MIIDNSDKPVVAESNDCQTMSAYWDDLVEQSLPDDEVGTCYSIYERGEGDRDIHIKDGTEIFITKTGEDQVRVTFRQSELRLLLESSGAQSRFHLTERIIKKLIPETQGLSFDGSYDNEIESGIEYSLVMTAQSYSEVADRVQEIQKRISTYVQVLHYHIRIAVRSELRRDLK